MQCKRITLPRNTISICIYAKIDWLNIFIVQVSEDDSLPNFVCYECWSITETFHKLYQKTQLAQAKFLNVIIKTEIDTMEVVPENTELIICDENSIEIGEVKLEQVKENPHQNVHFIQFF